MRRSGIRAIVQVFRFDQAEFLWLAQAHRGIPDVELRRLLGLETILLTTDRVLHNQVCELGFHSYTLDEHGNLRRRELPGVRAPKQISVPRQGELKSDYVHPPYPLAQALKHGMTEKAFKHYKTRRRRIRSYFGSAHNIASVALTVGATNTAKGSLSGYFLRLAGKAGIKLLQATEGYSVSSARAEDPACCIIHALRELYLLQLESIPAQIYIIPPASLALCESLMKLEDGCPTTEAGKCLQRLLKGTATAGILPCVKGHLFERMQRKLQQLTSARTNEVVTVEWASVISAINEQP